MAGDTPDSQAPSPEPEANATPETAAAPTPQDTTPVHPSIETEPGHAKADRGATQPDRAFGEV